MLVRRLTNNDLNDIVSLLKEFYPEWSCRYSAGAPIRNIVFRRMRLSCDSLFSCVEYSIVLLVNIQCL